MDVQINHVSADIDVTDPEAMLTPRVVARLTAAVREQLRSEAMLEQQRATDRKPTTRLA